jgi:hypothetical protein
MSCNCHEEFPETTEVWFNEETQMFTVVHKDAHGEELSTNDVTSEDLADCVKNLTK